MKTYDIDLISLTAHGKAKTQSSDGALDIWTMHSIASIGTVDFCDRLKKHYVSLPEKYRLPLRVEMTVKLDFPAFYLFVGDGHIAFASQGQDNRKLEDILKHSGKPNQDGGLYRNSLPFGSYVDLSVTYNLDEMQITISGEERFYSRKQAYMKAKDIEERNAEGLEIGLAVSKLSTLSIQKMTITELDRQTPVIRGAFEAAKPHAPQAGQPKPTFERVISDLPQPYQDRLIEMDKHLMSLRPLKFKRMLDKGGGKITYVASEFGISYTFNVFGPQLMHYLNWYIVYNGKPDTWHRKADDMEELLAEIAQTDPALSDRIFYALNDCVGCYGPRCLAKTLYAYNGQKRLTCHGRVLLRMCDSDLCDAKVFLGHLNVLIQRRFANGASPPEKILLMKA